jgi:hypothetical protein
MLLPEDGDKDQEVELNNVGTSSSVLASPESNGIYCGTGVISVSLNVVAEACTVDTILEMRDTS